MFARTRRGNNGANKVEIFSYQSEVIFLMRSEKMSKDSNLFLVRCVCCFLETVILVFVYLFAGCRKNYCAKYNKLAGSDEIFCDEVGDVERWGDYGAEMMCELSQCSSSLSLIHI